LFAVFSRKEHKERDSTGDLSQTWGVTKEPQDDGEPFARPIADIKSSRHLAEYVRKHTPHRVATLRFEAARLSVPAKRRRRPPDLSP